MCRDFYAYKNSSQLTVKEVRSCSALTIHLINKRRFIVKLYLNVSVCTTGAIFYSFLLLSDGKYVLLLKWKHHGPLKRWYPITILHHKQLHPQDWCSMDLWNAGILPQHYTVSQPIRLKTEAAWTSKTLVSYHNTTLHDVTTQKTEDGGSMDLWNVSILPQCYTA